MPSLGVLVRRLLLFVFLFFLVPSFTAADHAEASQLTTGTATSTGSKRRTGRRCRGGTK